MRIIVLLAVALVGAQTSDPTSVERVPGAVFDDCESCPQMVVIPSGKFTMGLSDAHRQWVVAHGGSLQDVADETPPHKVSIKSFALGEYDVTAEQYGGFIQATGYRPTSNCDWHNPGFAQTDLSPAVCVSWQDAQAYIAWLNTQVAGAAPGAPYRLPTEAEWEYAARGGSTTLFWWGDDVKIAAENAWFDENSGHQSHPIGMQPENAFGLFDIAGNVWQWTQDCYRPTYAGASADGRAATGGADCPRVDRGGSWSDPLWMLRPAMRRQNPANEGNPTIGFRVARDL